MFLQEYEEVGAVITEDLSEATHIIGVKAPEVEELIENKVYLIVISILNLYQIENNGVNRNVP